MLPKCYRLPSGRTRPDVIVRVSDGGRYDRWDPKTRTWIHVVNPVARDGLSHAIEGGDAIRISVRP